MSRQTAGGSSPRGLHRKPAAAGGPSPHINPALSNIVPGALKSVPWKARSACQSAAARRCGQTLHFVAWQAEQHKLPAKVRDGVRVNEAEGSVHWVGRQGLLAQRVLAKEHSPPLKHRRDSSATGMRCSAGSAKATAQAAHLRSVMISVSAGLSAGVCAQHLQPMVQGRLATCLVARC